MPPATADDDIARAEWLERLMRQFAESAPVPFLVVDPYGTVVVWNAEAANLFGWPAQEVLGRPVTETILPPPFSVEQLHREVPPTTAEGAVDGQRVVLIGHRRHGPPFPLILDVWSTPFGDSRSFSAYAYEAPEEEGVLLPSICAMGSLVESSGEAIIGTDTAGRILTWNSAAERVFGYCASEAVGLDISRMVPRDRQGELNSWMEELLAGTPVERQETVRRRRDGSLVDVALTITLVRNGEGQITGLSTIARDITQDRRMAAELDATLQGLEGALVDAKESEARGRHLLADVAHQLRAPIGGIRACAEALLRGTVAVGDERLLSGMVRETSRAARLITALLQMARLDDRANLSPAPCDLVALCEDEANRARILTPHVNFSVKVGRMAPTKPDLDADAVREIVANLLDNARRHADRKVEVSLTSVRRTTIEVKVRDDGPGLPQGAEERAFERFVTLDGKGGSGLGLSLARGLARAHGGDLLYHRGAFVLRLPVTSEQTRERGGVRPPRSLTNHSTVQRRTPRPARRR